MRPYLLLLLPLLISTAGRAQTDADSTRHELTFGAYADTYFASRTTDNPDNNRTRFLSAGLRDESFGLNLAELSVNYRGPAVRAQLTLHAGDIPQGSWSATFRNIQAANVGVRLGRGWWLDGGFFTTHIGYESIVPRRKFLSSVAYLSWNEPFFQSGLRLSYTADERWSFRLWALNGYNSFVDNNDAKSVGATVRFAPTQSTALTYNNLFGNEGGRADNATTRFRSVHNLYWVQQWSDALTTVANLTAMTQTNSERTDPEGTALLYGAYLTIDYALADRWTATARVETFSDEDGFVSGLVRTTDGSRAGLQVSGLTLGGQYRPSPSSYLRLESRYARQADEVALFRRDAQRVDGRLELLFTMGVAVERLAAW